MFDHWYIKKIEIIDLHIHIFNIKSENFKNNIYSFSYQSVSIITIENCSVSIDLCIILVYLRYIIYFINIII